MSRNKKILLGALTFLPFVLVIVYMVSFFNVFVSLPVEEPHIIEDNPVAFFRSIFGAMIWILLAALLGLAMMIYYLIHASRNTRISENERIVWILVLIFASSVGSIVYFFMHIVRLKEDDKRAGMQSYDG